MKTTKESPLLNVAAILPATRALGPGLRAVIWVQGCAFHCPGCIAPAWQEDRPARLLSVEAALDEALSNPIIQGMTLSGGEPFQQAQALALLCRLARKKKGRDFSILCFTGFTFENLKRQAPETGWRSLVAEVDTLIAGPFIASQATRTGLIGSTNKQIIHLTNRFRAIDFASLPRKVEVHIQDGNALVVGLPGVGTLSSIGSLGTLTSSERSYVRL